MIRLGTRASLLARWQAEWVAARLVERGAGVGLVPISTVGDRSQTGPVEQLGVGVFTKEIQRALADGRIDLAVHSLKDLPTEPVPGLSLAAVPVRGPMGDVLVTRERRSLDELPSGSRVGTGSLRRRAQLWHVRPDLQMVDIRGNVDTRLAKLAAGDYDAIILAEAGLRRLQFDEHVAHVLPPTIMLPAPGQGALGLETRSDDTATRAALAPLDDAATHASVLAERTLLANLRGGCLAPVGAWGRVEQNGQLVLEAVVLSHDGKQRLAVAESGSVAAAEAIGQRAAEKLIAQGAAELIAGSRGA